MAYLDPDDMRGFLGMIEIKGLIKLLELECISLTFNGIFDFTSRNKKSSLNRLFYRKFKRRLSLNPLLPEFLRKFRT